MSDRAAGVGEVRGLDGVRALAAFAVVVFHVAGPTISGAAAPAARAFSRLGGAGVGVFFVLSGFLLYRPFVAAADSRGRPIAWRFYWNRALRVYPAYWLVLTVTLFVLDDSRSYSADELARMYALVHTYDPALVLAGMEVSWTLVVEVSFYLVLPVVALVPLGLRRAVPALGAIGSQLVTVSVIYLGGVGYRLVMFAVSNDDRTFMLWLPSRADIFAMGMLLAVVQVTGARAEPLRWLAGRPWLSWMLAAAAYAGLVALDIPRAFTGERVSVFDVMARTALEGFLGFFLILPLALRRRSDVPSAGMRALELSPVVWLGTVSFGVYLWHIAALELVMELSDSGRFAPLFLPVLSLVTVCTVAVAAASFYGLERPVLEFKVASSRRSARPARS